MKVARVQISKEILEQILRCEILTEPGITITTTAPKDLEILGLSYPDSGFIARPRTFELFVKSETFEDVCDLLNAPLIPPFEYTIHRDGK